MHVEPATNPIEAEDRAAAILPEMQEVEAAARDEPDSPAEDGNPIAAGEPGPDPAEEEEVELDGELKLKVPKDQAQKVRDALLRQADYTRKTQALAAERAALASIQQASQAEIGTHAQLAAIDQQLAPYQGIDWEAWHHADPVEALKAEGRFQRLQHARQQSAGQLGALQQQRALAAQQETARRLQASAASLADPRTGIKGWGADYAARLLETGVRDYGFERSEIEAFEDHRMVRVLDDAAKWRAHHKAQEQAARHAAAQTAQPAARIGGASAPPAGLDDRVSADEWIRRRNEQAWRRG